MSDERQAHIEAHRGNLVRYRRLLETQLTELERDYIERRIAEEQAALDTTSWDGLPVVAASVDAAAAGRADR